MLRLCFFFFVGIYSAACYQNAHSKIVGGQDVDITEYPYQVSLQYLESHICGASIISEIYIITAAHCTNEKVAKYLDIRVGSSIRDENGEIFKIKQVHQHPKFNAQTYDYDITVIELSAPLTFGVKIQPIGLPSKDTILDPGTKCVVSGWGYPTEGSSFAEHLRAVEIPIVAHEKCQQYYDKFNSEISDRMICAGFEEGGKDACQGDSGGPLVSNKQLVGVVSWGEGCAQAKQPGIFANVANLRGFITEITEL